jgi:antitoxin (DNA-binding transcriptional repressor) of toxin-antitoxin stability system
LDEARRHLPELVRRLTRDDEVVITDADQHVARPAPVLPRPTLRDLKATSAGAVLQPYPLAQDDILGEMLGSR